LLTFFFLKYSFAAMLLLRAKLKIRADPQEPSGSVCWNQLKMLQFAVANSESSQQ